MNIEHSENDKRAGLSESERKAFESLSGDRAPLPDLEDRIVLALRRRGQIVDARADDRARTGFRARLAMPRITFPSLARMAGAMAALAVAFLMGSEFQKRTAPEPEIVYLERSAPVESGGLLAGGTDPVGLEAVTVTEDGSGRFHEVRYSNSTGHYCVAHETSDMHLCILEKTGGLLSQADY